MTSGNRASTLHMTAYHTTPGMDMPIRVGSMDRAWMDDLARVPYRCLPLLTANQYGWTIHLHEALTATWNGGAGLDAFILNAEGPGPHSAVSHFGGGILTFTIPYLFRTPQGWDLWVQGPPNTPRDGVHALSGIVEADESPATFTMNYAFTHPGTVRWEKDEAIAFLTPFPRAVIHVLETFDVRQVPITEEPEVQAAFHAWAQSRTAFNQERHVPGSEAQKKDWQRDYMLQARVKRINLPEFTPPPKAKPPEPL